MLFSKSYTKICIIIYLIYLGILPTIYAYEFEGDSLSINLANSPNQADRFELILKAITNSNTIEIINEYKPIALQICENTSIQNCQNEFYSTACNKLSDDSKQTSELTSLVLEWEKWAYAKNDRLGKAYTQFYLGVVNLNNRESEKFLSSMFNVKPMLHQTAMDDVLSFKIDNTLGHYYRDIGDFETANTYNNRCLQTALQLKDIRLISTAYNNYGRLYRKKSMYDSARFYFTKSLAIHRQLDNLRDIAISSNNLGNIYHVEGNLEKALVYYIESKEAKEKLKYKKGLCISYHNIAAVRLDLKQYDLALEDFEKSLAMSQELNDEGMQLHNYIKIGIARRAQGNLDEAIKNHKKANEIAKEINYDQGLIESNINLGKDLLKQKRYIDAFKYFKICLGLAEKNDRKSFISDCLIHIAECYLGIKENNKSATNPVESNIASIAEIEQMLLRGTKIAQEIGSHEHNLIALEALRKFYRDQKEYRKEAEVSDIYVNYRDSLYQEQSADAIAEWETKYETAEKEKEISILQASEEKSAAQIKLGTAISLLLLSIIGVGSYLYLQLQKVRKKLTLQNEQLNELNRTKDRFFGIIAYDIRSPIVALESVDEQMDYYIKKGYTEKLTRMGGLVGKTARHLNSLLDNLLNWALVQTNSMPYHPERIDVSEAWKETVELMHANAQVKYIKLISEIPSNLRVYADLPSFSTILRNLTSNALKFSKPNTDIIFKASKGKTHVKLEVIDQGVGMSEELVSRLFSLEKKSKKGTAGEKGTGLGLILCKELVELNGGIISVESKEGEGSTFCFTIPIKSI